MLPCPLQMSLDWTKLTNPPFFRIPCPSHWWKNVASNHGTTIPLASPQGLATSEDGLHWQRACNGQPVMSPGFPGDFDALFVVSWRQIRWRFRGAYGGGGKEWHLDWCENDVSTHLEYRVWWCVSHHVEDLWSPGATRMTMLIMLP